MVRGGGEYSGVRSRPEAALRPVPEGVRIVEVYNGGSRDREDEIAQAMAAVQGYLGIGGSDAHIVSHVGRCATRFPAPVRSELELVEALNAGDFEAISNRQPT